MCDKPKIIHEHFESWNLSDAILSFLKGWNARCLAHITGRSIPEEARDPSFKLINKLKARRLKWVKEEFERLKDDLEEGREMRWSTRSIIARAESMLATGGYKNGFVLEDAPKHNSVQQLINATKGEWGEAMQKWLD